MYSTLLYSTLLYPIILYSTPLYPIILYSALLYSTLLYSTLLYSTLLLELPNKEKDFLVKPLLRIERLLNKGLTRKIVSLLSPCSGAREQGNIFPC